MSSCYIGVLPNGRNKVTLRDLTSAEAAARFCWEALPMVEAEQVLSDAALGMIKVHARQLCDHECLNVRPLARSLFNKACAEVERRRKYGGVG